MSSVSWNNLASSFTAAAQAWEARSSTPPDTAIGDVALPAIASAASAVSALDPAEEQLYREAWHVALKGWIRNIRKGDIDRFCVDLATIDPFTPHFPHQTQSFHILHQCLTRQNRTLFDELTFRFFSFPISRFPTIFRIQWRETADKIYKDLYLFHQKRPLFSPPFPCVTTSEECLLEWLLVHTSDSLVQQRRVAFRIAVSWNPENKTVYKARSALYEKHPELFWEGEPPGDLPKELPPHFYNAEYARLPHPKA